MLANENGCRLSGVNLLAQVSSLMRASSMYPHNGTENGGFRDDEKFFAAIDASHRFSLIG
jgi:hypothetical protein